MKRTHKGGGGVAHNNNYYDAHNIGSLVVVAWPCALAVAAAATMWTGTFEAVEAVVAYMINHIQSSPTESAAAAIFAVVIAVSSSGLSVVAELGTKASAIPPKGSTAKDARGAGLAAVDGLLEQMRSVSDAMAERVAGLAHACESSGAEYIAVTQAQYEASLQRIRDALEAYVKDGGRLGAPPTQSATPGRLPTSDPLARQRSLRALFLRCERDRSEGALPAPEDVRRLFEVGPGSSLYAYVGNEQRWQELPSGGQPPANVGANAGASPVRTGHAWPGLRYSASCMPLRKGLNVYRTRTVIPGASCAEFLAFMTDDAFRRRWDDTVAVWEARNVTSACCASAAKQSKGKDAAATGSHRVTLSDVYCKVRMPRPLSAREYLFERSVWVSQGGKAGQIICAIRPPPHGGPGAASVGSGLGGIPGRSIAVCDYLSCCHVREVWDDATQQMAAEVVYMYFEDSRLPPPLSIASSNASWGRGLSRPHRHWRHTGG